jgi:hypothetical protein
MGVVIPKLRQSARGQPCNFMLPGCTGDSETTVLCHCRVNYLGMASKPPDFFAAFGCASCHEKIDNHRLPPEEEYRAWLCAIRRTQQAWFDDGLMQFPETVKRQAAIPKIVRRPAQFHR